MHNSRLDPRSRRFSKSGGIVVRNEMTGVRTCDDSDSESLSEPAMPYMAVRLGVASRHVYYATILQGTACFATND